jgi:hypothetical protein
MQGLRLWGRKPLLPGSHSSFTAPNRTFNLLTKGSAPRLLLADLQTHREGLWVLGAGLGAGR